MGLTKTENFSFKQNRTAELAKAFAHPARVAIIQHLLKEKSCICNDLVEVLPLSQATISQHLQELKKIGIIKGEVNPPKVCYCIDETVWREFREVFQEFINVLSISEQAC
ncbi:MAG: metalloregulator ArsR/SmtB family transcription factor [Raineya sp.]